MPRSVVALAAAALFFLATGCDPGDPVAPPGASAPDATPAAGVGSSGGAATGAVVWRFGHGSPATSRWLSFSARIAPDGSVRGRFHFRWEDPDMVWDYTGDVVCLALPGEGKAVLSGRMDPRFEREIGRALGLNWAVQDGAAIGAPVDRALPPGVVRASDAGPSSCRRPVGQLPPITTGQITVR